MFFGQAQDDLAGAETIPIDITDQSIFVQQLFEALNLDPNDNSWQDAQLHVETWFSDHVNFRTSHFTRTVALGPLVRFWEQQLRLRWQDYVDPHSDVEFVLVHPLPEDVERGISVQIILVQHPLSRLCSSIVTIYDSAYDNGAPHSSAIVLPDRVSLSVVTAAVDFGSLCPPEQPYNDCTLWFGSLEIHPHQQVAARHGYAFRLVVQRPQEVDIQAMLALGDDELRHSLVEVLEDAAAAGARASASRMPVMPTETITPTDDGWRPDWFNSVAERFRLFGLTAGIVHTWFLNGQYSPQCPHSRQVALSDDNTAWEALLVAAWHDHADVQLPFFLHFVDPAPPGALSTSHIGHVIVVQQPLENYAAVLLTRNLYSGDELEHHHTAVYTSNRLSAVSARALMLAPDQARGQQFQVRIGSLRFPEQGAPRIGDGDNIVVEPADDPAHDELNLLQVGIGQKSFTQIPNFLLADILQSSTEDQEAAPVCSFTDEFLQAVDSSRQTQNNMGPIEGQPLELTEFSEFTQRLFGALQLDPHDPAWRDAPLHVETWYSDHTRLRLSRFTRVVTLSPAIQFWEDQLRRRWQDWLDPQTDVEFVIVYPLPVDVEQGVLVQVILIQNTFSRFCSTVLTICDSAYDNGAPHSIALVLPDRVGIQVVIAATDLDLHCPLDEPFHDCSLWLGSFEIQRHQQIVARHGHAFRLVVQRPPDFDLRATSLPGDNVAYSSARALADYAIVDLPTETIHSLDDDLRPAWQIALAEQFTRHHLIPDNSGDAIGSVITWFLNGQFAPRCSRPRQATLTADRAAWEGTLVSLWRDQADLQFPFWLHFVAPAPPGGHLPGRLGHILIVQMPAVRHAAILLTRSIQTEEVTECQHVAVYTANRLSASAACALAAPPSLPAPLHLCCPTRRYYLP